MSHPSRRSFLQTAGVAAAVPKGRQQSGFAPQAKPRKITENLYLFEDTCNVYVVKDGPSAVLIDFGSGRILDHLAGLGISKVDWVLHTHHHRDQCQGDKKAVARGIPIAVPAHERHLFAEAENFWRNRRVFHLYYMRNDFNTVTENIPVARGLADYSVFRWNKLEFLVRPAPGHTLGSIALLATIDGKKTAFTGDLFCAPGKIPNLYDLQVGYGGSEGVDLAIWSLSRLKEQTRELLCPSHGEPMADAGAAIEKTLPKLVDYYRYQAGAATEFNRPIAVSPHLVAHHQTTSSFYAILSDSGKAMFIDYGSASGNVFGTFMEATAVRDRIRFIEHSIDTLRRDYGLKKIDVALPSHMHDDHINGFPHLIRQYGAAIWCYENMVDILERPRGHNLGCILAEPVKIARSFRHGERFRWEEFDFEITHSPGHTEYQMALFSTIDGQRVAFTGDAFFQNPGASALRHNLIFRNHVENDSHLKSIHNLIDHEPNLICPGHGKPFPVAKEALAATLTHLDKQQRLFFDLLPEGEVDFGLDPSWVSLDPYQVLLKPGEAQTLKVRVQNYKSEPMKLEIALVAPAEWRIEPDVLRFEAAAKAITTRELTVAAPRGWVAKSPRLAIAADVVRDGKYLGQITEAVVDVI
jgi:glyoxylase-like metal-dependent hydrolase (beta-lactamase superfamily II)